MRPRFSLLLVAALALGACSNAADRQTDPNATPAPLQPCETREMHERGVDLTIESNANGTLASIRVIGAPDDAQERSAVAFVEHTLGTPSPDPRQIERPWHLGLTQLTDPCGRTVTPSP